MTIEYSLRRRAMHARYMAVFWLTVATLILVGTYVSLPLVAKSSLSIVHSVETEPNATSAPPVQAPTENKTMHAELYSMAVMALGLLAVCFACFLLGRTAFVEIELSARFVAFADALCLVGENFDQLEKAVNLLLPGTKYLSVPEIFSIKDLSSMVDILKELRSK